MILLTPLLLWACKSPDGCTTSEDPTVTVGTGETQYTVHEDGGPVDLIHGPQGGYHITLAFETTGFDARDDVVAYIEGTIDGQLIAEATPFVYLRCNRQAGTQQAWDFRLIYEDEPENLDNKLTEVSVLLTDVRGKSAEAETTFVIHDAPPM